MSSSTLELTLIELINGLYRKIDSIHTFKIGGDAFTDIIINILCDEFKRFLFNFFFKFKFFCYKIFFMVLGKIRI